MGKSAADREETQRAGMTGPHDVYHGGGRRQRQREVGAGALGGVSRGWRGACDGFVGRRR